MGLSWKPDVVNDGSAAIGLRLIGDDGWQCEVVALAEHSVLVEDTHGRRLEVSRLDLRHLKDDAPYEDNR